MVRLNEVLNQTFRQVNPLAMLELQRFFLDYKTLEGKTVEVDEPLGPDEALGVLREAIDLYNREQNRLR